MAERVDINQDPAPQTKKEKTEIDNPKNLTKEREKVEISGIDKKDAGREKREINLDTPDNPKK